MKSLNRASIMTKANSLRKVYGLTKSEALRKAWGMAKIANLESELFLLEMKDTFNNKDTRQANELAGKIRSLIVATYPTVTVEQEYMCWHSYEKKIDTYEKYDLNAYKVA